MQIKHKFAIPECPVRRKDRRTVEEREFCKRRLNCGLPPVRIIKNE
jgi:hypothetical protein